MRLAIVLSALACTSVLAAPNAITAREVEEVIARSELTGLALRDVIGALYPRDPEELSNELVKRVGSKHFVAEGRDGRPIRTGTQYFGRPKYVPPKKTTAGGSTGAGQTQGQGQGQGQGDPEKSEKSGY
ncbi:hypothetical protein EIP91_010691 [Steccherinum ochraceum]|uniref:Uncharacterized protein n=1 Tax=Steccherinum ochraceum TaxID=92696 RepID=A0A4R0R875_9APHY|nr:hypothetical protein EIP91_010691 [Steccherinum ochraceum]